MAYNNTTSSVPYPHETPLSYTSDAASSDAPPSYADASTPSQSRVLHVYHQGLTHRTTQILAADKSTVLYNIKTSSCCHFSSKPHVTVYDAAGAQIATVTFHSLSQKIDLVIHGEPILFAPSGHFTSAHEWTSLATAATTARGLGAEKEKGEAGVPRRFTWKCDKWHGLDMVCRDERKEAYARFDSSTWAMHKEGKFEMGPAVDDGALMDEMVVTGFAMLELRRRNGSTASA